MLHTYRTVVSKRPGFGYMIFRTCEYMLVRVRIIVPLKRHTAARHDNSPTLCRKDKINLFGRIQSPFSNTEAGTASIGFQVTVGSTWRDHTPRPGLLDNSHSKAALLPLVAGFYFGWPNRVPFGE